MHITSLNIYPIKGCRGVAVNSVVVDRVGLVGDRRMMIVDTKNHFISQRENPRLATVIPSLVDGVVRLEAPGMPPLVHRIEVGGPPRDVTVWGYTVITAADQGDVIAQWL